MCSELTVEHIMYTESCDDQPPKCRIICPRCFEAYAITTSLSPTTGRVSFSTNNFSRHIKLCWPVPCNAKPTFKPAALIESQKMIAPHNKSVQSNMNGDSMDESIANKENIIADTIGNLSKPREIVHLIA